MRLKNSIKLNSMKEHVPNNHTTSNEEYLIAISANATCKRQKFSAHLFLSFLSVRQKVACIRTMTHRAANAFRVLRGTSTYRLCFLEFRFVL